MTGFHSVIDSPDRVSRVMPPTTTIRKISPQQTNSHPATAFVALRAAAAFAALNCCAVVDRDKTAIPEQSRCPAR